MKIDYEKTCRIDLLNEYSNGVYATFVRFLVRNKIDLNNEGDKYPFYAQIFNQMAVMGNINLFTMSMEEIKEVEKYWKHTSSLIDEIIKEREIA